MNISGIYKTQILITAGSIMSESDDFIRAVNNGALNFRVVINSATKDIYNYLYCIKKAEKIIKKKLDVLIDISNMKYDFYEKKSLNFFKDDIKRIFSIYLLPNYFIVPFVTNRDNSLELNQLYGNICYNKDIKFIVKIDNKKCIDNIDMILKYSDGILIDRKDLILSINPITMPTVQRFLVNKATSKKKLCIIANDFLERYVTTGTVNRAELSDIALATYQKASALMLNIENNYNKYPYDSINLMNKVIEQTWNN